MTEYDILYNIMWGIHAIWTVLIFFGTAAFFMWFWNKLIDSAFGN